MNILPDDFVPERVTLKLAMYRNTKAEDNPKQPLLRGYLLVRKPAAEALLKACEDRDDGTIFLDVAVWDDGATGKAKNEKYPLNGTIRAQHYDRDKEQAKAKLEVPKKQPPTLWY